MSTRGDICERATFGSILFRDAEHDFSPRRNRFDFSPFRRGIDRRVTSRFPRWSTHRKILSSSRRSHRSDAQPKVRWHEYPVSFGSWTRVNNAASLSPRFETARKNVPVAINNREDLSCRFGGGGDSRLLLLWSKSKRKIKIIFLSSQNPGAEKWRPMAISNPSTRLRMARSMPHWVLVRRSFSFSPNRFLRIPRDSKYENIS